MSKYSVSTVLIHALRGARRSRKRMGSVACTEQGREGEIIGSLTSVRISRVGLKCILEDETQWGVNIYPVSHDGLGDTSAFAKGVIVRPSIRHSRRAFNEKVNGVKSQPTHDTSSHNVNSGSPTQEGTIKTYLHGDGVPIVPKGLPVMGKAIGNQSDSGELYKSLSNEDETNSSRGEVEQFLCSTNKRKEVC